LSLQEISHNISVYIFLKADYSRSGSITQSSLTRWATDSPDEFAIIEDLFNFDTEFFSNYREIAIPSKKAIPTETIVGSGLGAS
jgi:hypothetical protein